MTAEEAFEKIFKACLDSHGDKKKGIETLQQYANEVSREVAIEFATQIDDTYDEGTPFEERLKRWGDIFDKWKSNQDDK